MQHNNTIIITGASRGIGRAIALAFAKPGNNVVISCHTSKSDLEEVKMLVEEGGAQCEAFVGDMSSYEEVRRMYDLTYSRFGGVDILVNNAGAAYIGLFQDMDEAQWDRIISTNLKSVYNCSHFAVKNMLARHSGRIVNISSVWGVCGASCEVAYSASKGAVNAFTKALAKELAPSNIQVNAIACGVIDTVMNSHLSAEELDELVDTIPTNRLGKPEDVADLVLSLTSTSSYLTGQVINLDGAWI